MIIKIQIWRGKAQEKVVKVVENGLVKRKREEEDVQRKNVKKSTVEKEKPKKNINLFYNDIKSSSTWYFFLIFCFNEWTMF